ncbi:hypothetical protein BJ912DRAFT_223177 [Pholiota molesta]|nr:hypothetical protein BJ912DRAFT_223177 [Pholiota molesta]
MFVFPSKSVDSSSTSTTTTITPTTNNLIPPSDPRPRATRRTSISDMVQRYEAIGTTGRPGASIPPPPPSPIHKPVASRATPAAAESNRVVKPSDTGKIISAKVPLANDSYVPSHNYRSKSRSQSKDSIRRANSSTRSPSKVHRKLTSDRETPAAEDKDKTPRSKRISSERGRPYPLCLLG